MSNIWNKISAYLMFTDSEHKLDVYILLETGEEYGLSTLDMLHINKMWQIPGSGEIAYMLEGSDEEYDLSELEEWQLNEIYEQLLTENVNNDIEYLPEMIDYDD